MKKTLININPIKDLIKDKLIEKYDNTVYMNTNSIDIKLDIKDIIEDYVKELELPEPKIYMTADAYAKMRALVDKMSKEVGWYGTVKQMPGLESTYLIDDIIVYPQKVTGVTCEQDEEKIFEFEMGLTTDQVNHKRFQGHSHVNMGVTPSGVDEQFYQDLLTQVTDYFIIMVTKKRNDYTIRFYDMEHNILYSDMSFEVILEDGTVLSTWYDTVKDEVEEPIPVATTVSTYHGSVFDKFVDEDIYNYHNGYMTVKPRKGKGKRGYI